MTYPNTQLFINGEGRDAIAGESLAVCNPETGKEIGRVAHARDADLDLALAAAQKGFETRRDMPAIERRKIMRTAGGLMRERAARIAEVLTQEEGKPLAEARGESMAAADIIEWFADEGLRVYVRVVPSRFNLATHQMVLKETLPKSTVGKVLRRELCHVAWRERRKWITPWITTLWSAIRSQAGDPPTPWRVI